VIRQRACLLACALACSLVHGACSRSHAPAPVRFENVTEGVSTARIEVAAEPAFTAVAFEVDLTKLDVRLVRASAPGGLTTVDAMTAGLGDHLAVNASFFDVDGKTMGRATDRSGVHAADRRTGWGALVIDGADQARIVLGDALPKEPKPNELVVQGVPRLVVGGSVMKLKAQTAARTAVCAAGSTLMLVVTTEADTGALASFLAKPRDAGGLGCKDALNLDGGPSTQLFAQLGSFRLALPGGSGVPNALVLTPRADVPPAPAAVADAGVASSADAGATGP
jgi:Phosphodiester glycosidase